MSSEKCGRCKTAPAAKSLRCDECGEISRRCSVCYWDMGAHHAAGAICGFFVPDYRPPPTNLPSH